MARAPLECADIALVGRPPQYGGHPSPLATDEGLELAQALLLEGRPADYVAAELGYPHRSTFVAAYTRATGERPGAYQTRHGVTIRKRIGGHPVCGRRSTPDRTGQRPLPRYDAKKKVRKRRRKKKRRVDRS